MAVTRLEGNVHWKPEASGRGRAQYVPPRLALLVEGARERSLRERNFLDDALAKNFSTVVQ